MDLLQNKTVCLNTSPFKVEKPDTLLCVKDTTKIHWNLQFQNRQFMSEIVCHFATELKVKKSMHSITIQKYKAETGEILVGIIFQLHNGASRMRLSQVTLLYIKQILGKAQFISHFNCMVVHNA